MFTQSRLHIPLLCRSAEGADCVSNVVPGFAWDVTRPTIPAEQRPLISHSPKRGPQQLQAIAISTKDEIVIRSQSSGNHPEMIWQSRRLLWIAHLIWGLQGTCAPAPHPPSLQVRARGREGGAKGTGEQGSGSQNLHIVRHAAIDRAHRIREIQCADDLVNTVVRFGEVLSPHRGAHSFGNPSQSDQNAVLRRSRLLVAIRYREFAS